MHFVICVFIALVCLATAVLFTEVFPKVLKAVLGIIGALSSGYALAILIRKISMWTNAFAKPALLTTALICAVIMLIIIFAVKTILNKKKAK